MKFADADATFAKGDVAHAERMYDKLLRAHSNQQGSWLAWWTLRRADCLFRLGRLDADAAEAACRETLKLQLKMVSAHELLAAVLHQMVEDGRFERIHEEFDEWQLVCDATLQTANLEKRELLVKALELARTRRDHTIHWDGAKGDQAEDLLRLLREQADTVKALSVRNSADPGLAGALLEVLPTCTSLEILHVENALLAELPRLVQQLASAQAFREPVTISVPAFGLRITLSSSRSVAIAATSFRGDRTVAGRLLVELASIASRCAGATISWRLQQCSLLGPDCIIAQFAALLDGSQPFSFAAADCDLGTKGLERLGSLLHRMSDTALQRVVGIDLHESAIGRHIKSTAELLGLLVRSPLIDLFILGNGEAGKTQLEARLRGAVASMAAAIRTIGANSLNRRIMHQAHKMAEVGGLRGLGQRVKARFQDRPRDAPPLGDTGYLLGDVVEIGGQIEYRYLYQFLGSLYRIHVIVVRIPDDGAPLRILDELQAILQVLACCYTRDSELVCPAILAVVNGTAPQLAALTEPSRRMITQKIADWCKPGLCKTVFINACDNKTFDPFYEACASLWEQRGALVTADRRTLVENLHGWVQGHCRLELWTKDAQQLVYNPAESPVLQLVVLLDALEVPETYRDEAALQLIEAGEIIKLPSKPGQPALAIAWPQMAYDLTAIFIHHHYLPDPPAIKDVPHSQRRDASLLHIINGMKKIVPPEQVANFARGIINTSWFANMLADPSSLARDRKGSTISLAALAASPTGSAAPLLSICEVATGLGICFRFSEDTTTFQFPALMPDSPGNVKAVWPVPCSAEGFRATGLCIKPVLPPAAADLHLILPPGLFHRLQVSICRICPSAAVVVWKSGLVITAASLSGHVPAHPDDLKSCFVRVEHAQDIRVFVLARPVPGRPAAALSKLMYTLTEQCVSWLREARDAAGFPGLGWTQHILQNEGSALVHRLQRDHERAHTDLTDMALIPIDLVVAESRSGSLVHQLTAPHLYVPNAVEQLSLRHMKQGKSQLQLQFALRNAAGGTNCGDAALEFQVSLSSPSSAEPPLVAVLSASLSGLWSFMAPLPDKLITCRRWTAKIEALPLASGLLVYEQSVELASLMPPVDESYACKQHGVCAHDVFISYRVATERDVAGQLAEALVAARPGITVFLDSRCLALGEPWQGGFCNCLRRSRLILLLVSPAGMVRCRQADKQPDNMLLEFEHAFVRRAEARTSVLPLLLADPNANGKFDYSALDPKTFPTDLHAHEWSAMPVAAVIEEVAALQGIKAYNRAITPGIIDDILRQLDASTPRAP